MKTNDGSRDRRVRVCVFVIVCVYVWVLLDSSLAVGRHMRSTKLAPGRLENHVASRLSDTVTKTLNAKTSAVVCRKIGEFWERSAPQQNMLMRKMMKRRKAEGGKKTLLPRIFFIFVALFIFLHLPETQEKQQATSLWSFN